MTKTITLEGDLAAADTAYNLTTQGSVSAPSRKVPEGVSEIDKIIVSASADLAAAGSAVFIIRLGGSAVKDGEQVLAVAAVGGQLPQTGADPSGCPTVLAVLEDLGIAVKPDIIRVQAEMAGDDLGTGRVVVTLVFK